MAQTILVKNHKNPETKKLKIRGWVGLRYKYGVIICQMPVGFCLMYLK